MHSDCTYMQKVIGLSLGAMTFSDNPNQLLLSPGQSQTLPIPHPSPHTVPLWLFLGNCRPHKGGEGHLGQKE